MLKKLDVPTRQPKEFLLKYFSSNAFYTASIGKRKKRHSPQFSNILCKFFAADSCLRGADCSFSHDTTQVPCADLVQNRVCTKSQCGFKHSFVLPYDQQATLVPPTNDKHSFVSPFS